MALISVLAPVHVLLKSILELLFLIKFQFNQIHLFLIISNLIFIQFHFVRIFKNQIIYQYFISLLILQVI